MYARLHSMCFFCAVLFNLRMLFTAVQVRRVRLHLRLRLEEAAPLQELWPPGVLFLRADVLAAEHAAANLQR